MHNETIAIAREREEVAKEFEKAVHEPARGRVDLKLVEELLERNERLSDRSRDNIQRRRSLLDLMRDHAKRQTEQNNLAEKMVLEISLKLAERKASKSKFDYQVSKVEKAHLLQRIGLTVGVLMMVLGFALWYFTIQVYQDVLIRQQVTEKVSCVRQEEEARLDSRFKPLNLQSNFRFVAPYWQTGV
ncbi:MAG TPA: hypothetical protein VIS96_19350 [Terrimicrobiaceae bacterium]